MTGVTAEAAEDTIGAEAAGVPAHGQLVTVRNRPWVVTEVTRSTVSSEDPARAADASAPHLVALVSVEDDARDEELRVVWELEQGAVVHQQYELPSPCRPMSPTRWASRSPASPSLPLSRPRSWTASWS